MLERIAADLAEGSEAIAAVAMIYEGAARMTTRIVGPKAIALMHHFEQCRLNAYRCSAGVATIGWGMTYYPSGLTVKMGDRITRGEADAGFAHLLERDFAPAVASAIGNAPTTAAQFGAMVALAYNIGTGPSRWVAGMRSGFRQSAVLKRHLAGDLVGASAAFTLWNKADGKVSPGLVRRRAAEAALYRSDFAELARQTHGVVS